MLSDADLERIETLIDEGDDLLNQDAFAQAIVKYIDAARLLPEPKEQFDIALTLFVALGEAYFFAGDYQQAERAFRMAMKAPGGVENPLTHLRLGQTHFELGELDKAADELTRAYMLDGFAIFSGEDNKYLAFLRTRIKL